MSRKQKTPKAKPKAAKTAVRKRVEYSAELGEQVLDHIIDGRTLKEIEAMPGMPSRTTIFKWRKRHEEFAAEYTEAMDMQADGIADDADALRRDMLAGKITSDVMREALKEMQWAAAVRAPRRYSQNQKVELSGKDGGPIVVNETNPNRMLDLARGMALIFADAALVNGEANAIDKLLLGNPNEPPR